MTNATKPAALDDASCPGMTAPIFTVLVGVIGKSFKIDLADRDTLFGIIKPLGFAGVWQLASHLCRQDPTLLPRLEKVTKLLTRGELAALHLAIAFGLNGIPKGNDMAEIVKNAQTEPQRP